MKAGCIPAFSLTRVTATYFSWAVIFNPSCSREQLALHDICLHRGLRRPGCCLDYAFSPSLHPCRTAPTIWSRLPPLASLSPFSSPHPHHNYTSTTHKLFALAFARSPIWSDSSNLIKNGGTCICGTRPRLTRLQKLATQERKICSLTSN